MPTLIVAESPDTADAIGLIKELDEYLEPLYPRESRHGFSVEQLVREGVAFFIVRQDGMPAACGGIKLFGDSYGEIKRMYVRPQFRGSGLGKRMLQQLSEYALLKEVRVLRLETGIYQLEAVALYERCGFRRVGPFGAYQQDPLSVFFEKTLT